MPGCARAWSRVAPPRSWHAAPRSWAWRSSDRACATKPRRCARFSREQHLERHEVAYIGDDLNDLPLLAEVGLTAAPADAPYEVRAEVYMVLSAAGGRGCLREFIEAILRARGDWERALAAIGVKL